jgi:hypothetical protein
MKAKGFAVLAAIGLILAGCGTYHWHKEGADDAAFQRDSDSCRQQPGGSWQECMTGKGWVYSAGI